MQKMLRFCKTEEIHGEKSMSSGRERNICNKFVIYCGNVEFSTNTRSLVDKWGECGQIIHKLVDNLDYPRG